MCRRALCVCLIPLLLIQAVSLPHGHGEDCVSKRHPHFHIGSFFPTGVFAHHHNGEEDDDNFDKVVVEDADAEHDSDAVYTPGAALTIFNVSRLNSHLLRLPSLDVCAIVPSALPVHVGWSPAHAPPLLPSS